MLHGGKRPGVTLAVIGYWCVCLKVVVAFGCGFPDQLWEKPQEASGRGCLWGSRTGNGVEISLVLYPVFGPFEIVTVLLC